MQTGHRCPVCDRPILTNAVIVGFPVIRITDVNKSAMTGDEIIIHVDCFIARMRGTGSKLTLIQNGIKPNLKIEG
jgi:hypothetical protein